MLNSIKHNSPATTLPASPYQKALLTLEEREDLNSRYLFGILTWL